MNERIPITLDVRPRLIQAIRLYHAIAELGYPIAIHPEDFGTLASVSTVFNATFVDKTTCTRHIMVPVRLDHSTPRTTIGRIERPLVMPHGPATLSRSLWDTNRPIRCSFCGNVTIERLRMLRRWTRTNGRRGDARILLFAMRTLANRFTTRYLGPRPPVATRLHDTRVTHSAAGRHPTTKAVDLEYLRHLATSQFTLCPDGDFVWTYRFFEATLCGSIPVVGGTSPQYAGYRFLTLDTPLAGASWSEEDAEFNFQRTVDLLTVPPHELHAEIRRLTSF